MPSTPRATICLWWPWPRRISSTGSTSTSTEMETNRRRFLFTAGAAITAHAAPPADQIALGVIGSGGRGTLVMSTFQKDAAVRVGAICDVYEPNLERAASAAVKAGGTAPK